MAATSVSGRPSTSSVGTLPSGLSARNSEERVSFLAKDRDFASNGVPISCKAMCAAIELEPGAKNSVSIDPQVRLELPKLPPRLLAASVNWQRHAGSIVVAEQFIGAAATGLSRLRECAIRRPLLPQGHSGNPRSL